MPGRGSSELSKQMRDVMVVGGIFVGRICRADGWCRDGARGDLEVRFSAWFGGESNIGSTSPLSGEEREGALETLEMMHMSCNSSDGFDGVDALSCQRVPGKSLTFHCQSGREIIWPYFTCLV